MRAGFPMKDMVDGLKEVDSGENNKSDEDVVWSVLTLVVPVLGDAFVFIESVEREEEEPWCVQKWILRLHYNADKRETVEESMRVKDSLRGVKRTG